MKKLSIFEPQIEEHYAYKKKNMYIFWVFDTILESIWYINLYWYKN